MEEWREVSGDGGNGKGHFGSGFDVDFRIEKYRFYSCKEKLRNFFDQLLVAFLREKSVTKCIRPIPALCGDGRPVDLFKLFWIVRKIGGRDAVSRNYLWGFVSEECGLSCGVIPFIKLIYMKYLNELDQWLQQVFSKDVSEDGLGEVVQKLDLLCCELENGRKEQEKRQKDGDVIPVIIESELLSLISKQETRKLCNGDDHFGSAGRNDDSIVYGSHCDTSGDINDNFAALSQRTVKKLVNEANGFSKGQIDVEFGKFCDDDSDSIITSTKEIIDRVIDKVLNNEKIVAQERHPPQDNKCVCVLAEKDDVLFNGKANDLLKEVSGNEERLSAQKSIHSVTPAGSEAGIGLESRKRKQQSLPFSEMLRWLIHVAKHSDDPSVSSIPECSKWSDYGAEELWRLALLVRERLLIRRHPLANVGQSLLKDQRKKPRMHPSMYEENVSDLQHKEKQRYSTRIPSLTKSNLCPCCNSCATPSSKVAICQEERIGNDHKAPVELVVTDVDEPPTTLDDHKSSDVPVERQVSMGPLFQAEVPEWTGVHSESDPKWLGTRMWQPEEDEGNSSLGLRSIGKGRRHPCTCPFPCSVECVRFHIAEKRLKLKQELGLLFYHWRFDWMGEEVSLSWTEEEEKTFKDMIKLNAPSPNKFWNNASRFFPSKTRQNLVSYYFNVLLVQRRSYQNRVTPKDIDSDDDEKECGLVGSRFGYKALYLPCFDSISCTLNKESTELG